jgi:hypothetical protein
MVVEIHAAKQLVTGYHLYAADNDERFLRGYDVAPGRFFTTARAKNGDPIIGTTAQRYLVSASPSLGMNLYAIGGYGNGRWDCEGLLTRQSQSAGCEQLILFASAGRGSGDDLKAGNHEVSPPTGPEIWTTDDVRRPQRERRYLRFYSAT